MKDGAEFRDRAPVADENPIDVGVNDNGAARPFDRRQQATRDLAGAAHRVRRAVEVVRRDDRMHAETALAVRQSIVTPLRREHGFEFTAGATTIHGLSSRVA
jgi:hypothetical protein